MSEHKKMRELSREILADPKANELLGAKCRWEKMSRLGVLAEWGDPRTWPGYTGRHDPGPWEADDLRMDPDELPWGYLIRDADFNPVAGVFYIEDNAPAADEANARLIAAAPDLLAALKQLSEAAYHESPLIVDQRTGEPTALAHMVDAAIAKATGDDQ